MRVVTSGIGLRAGNVLSIMKEQMPEIEFVGYFDPQPTHLERIGVETPRFDDIKTMLDTTKPDLFFVGSPNLFHLHDIKLGLEAGVQIFTEKPVVTTVEDTFALAELLAKYGTDRVMVGLVLRYSQHMVDLRAALADGTLGAITSLEANEHIGPYHGAFFMRDWRRRTDYSGGFMLEKCCHDLDIYNMVTGSRPTKIASFGGRRSFVPENAPASNSENDIFHVKKSVWESVPDAFHSDGDIIDWQTAILSYDSGASLAFHTELNVPDEPRRFCGMGYTQGDPAHLSAHYGADHLMVADIAAFLKGETQSLPVGVVDALEAGLAALAMDEARTTGTIVDLTETWAKFDSYLLRK